MTSIAYLWPSSNGHVTVKSKKGQQNAPFLKTEIQTLIHTPRGLGKFNGCCLNLDFDYDFELDLDSY